MGFFHGIYCGFLFLASMIPELNRLIHSGFPKATRVGVEGGQGSRSDREAAPTLTPWNDPNAQGWWSGALFP